MTTHEYLRLSITEAEIEESEHPELLLKPLRHELFTDTRRIIYYMISGAIFFAVYAIFLLVYLTRGEKHDAPLILKKSWLEQYIETSSDFVIAGSYFMIPFLLIYIITKRTDVPFNGIFWMFGTFIVSCGMTHLFSLFHLWGKTSIFGPMSKFVTAVVSFGTAVEMMNLVPLALSLPSPAQLAHQISIRKRAEEKLQAQFRKAITVREITHNIRKSHRVEDIYETTVSQLGSELKLSRCSIILNVDNMSEVEAEYIDSTTESVKNVPPLSLKDSPFIQKALSLHNPTSMKKSEIVNDAPLLNLFCTWNIKSLLCIPIIPQTNVKGLILLQHCDTEYTWSQEDVGILEEVTVQVTVGLNQANLILTEQAREIAENSNKAKSDFLAVISHEVRTPMNGILGMISVMQSTGNLGPSEAQCLKTISETSNHLMTLLNTILDFSRIESGKQEIEERRFNLRECVDKINLLAKTMADDKGIKFQYRVSPETPEYIISDEVKLKQILVNLINNAIKFTSQGEVTVTLKPIKLTQEHIKLQFDVSDTGIGIPEKMISSLFKPFMQVDSSTTRKYGGTGLGLAISKKLCEALGGEIWVKSIENFGSIFSFTLLVRKDAPVDTTIIKEEEKIVPTISEFEKSKKRILVAEDNSVNQFVVKSMLSQSGFKNVDIVADGNLAYEAVMRANNEHQPYSVVLMDLHMANCDGITSTKMIRNTLQNSCQPYIIALTADIQPIVQEQCQVAGMNSFIGKPFTMKELNDALLAALALQYQN